MRWVALTAVAVVAMLGIAAPAAAQPNIVVVMTDDQDAASVRVMDQVQSRIARRGVTYANSFATTPTCCPSRASFLTGQYAHNTRVLQTELDDYLRFDDSRTLATALDQAGYRTGFIGKYLNFWAPTEPEHIPPGWDDWRALVNPDPGEPDSTFNQNGELDTHTGYRTDVIGRMGERFVSANRPEPFFLWISVSAPHKPMVPAPRHADVYANAPLPRPPSFNELDVSDKPAFVQERERLGGFKDTLRDEYRDRLGTLLAVDEMVDGLLTALRDAHTLSNTLVIFTSDNGYLMGEHRLYGKVRLYEESANVPLMIRGPGFPSGVTSQAVTGNIDLAPTMLDIANAEPGVEPDGRSLLEPFGDRALLLEAWPVPRKGWLETSVGLRTREYVYIEHDTGEQELYDFEADPYQLQSLHDAPAYDSVEAALEARLRALEDCAGAMCQ